MYKSLWLTPAFLLVACSPSVNPAMKKSVDSQIAALKPAAADYPAPANAEPFVPAPGQWVKMRMVDSKGSPSLVTYKLLAVENGHTITFETVLESYYGRSVHQARVVYDAEWKPIEFLAYKSKTDDGKVTEFSGPELALTNQVARSFLPMLVVQTQGLPPADVQVLAGTFHGCSATHQSIQLGYYSNEAEVWQHPVVPFGFVKSEGKDGSRSELVAFGKDGAKAEL